MQLLLLLAFPPRIKTPLRTRHCTRIMQRTLGATGGGAVGTWARLN